MADTKLAVGMIVFQGMPWLAGQLKFWYPYASQILIVEGPVQFWQDQGYKSSTDGTVEAILAFSDPDRKIRFIQGQWEEKEEMCNAYMGRIREDITHVWHVDMDEFYSGNTVGVLMERLHEFDVIGFRRLTFIGDFEHYLAGREWAKQSIPRVYRYYPDAKYYTHRPLSVLDPEVGERWHVTGNYLSHFPYQYHYTLVLPKQIAMKNAYYTGKWGRSWIPKNIQLEKWDGRHPRWIELNMCRILEDYGSRQI